MPIIILPPPSAGAVEGLVFDGLDLNDATGTPYYLEAFSCPPPKKRMEWAQGADADGAELVRDPLFENREITCRLRISPQANMDDALDVIGELVAKLEETERQTSGLPLVWTPAGAASSVTFFVLSGEFEEIPITTQGDDAGWLLEHPAPVITIHLTCRPFGYGEEVTEDPVTSSSPLLTLTVEDVLGDVPAEGRLIVTDDATQARRYVEWGLENRFYDATTDLLIDSADLVTSGYAGTSTTRTGAYSSNGVVRASVYRQPTAICGTDNLGHVGTFRVKARVYCTGIVSLRLAWRDGDGPLRANPYDTPVVAGAFCEIDLGLITISETELGDQQWAGQIEAIATANGYTADIDMLRLIPAGEGYGKARASSRYNAPAAVAAGDDFNTLAAATVLHGRTAVAGGTWATSGGTGDFAGSDALSTGNMTVRRTSTSDSDPRLAILGTTTKTDIEIAASVAFSAGSTADPSLGVFARYVDSDNYVRAEIHPQNSELTVYKRIGGGEIMLTANGTQTRRRFSPFGRIPVSVLGDNFYRLRLIIYASGRYIAQLVTAHGGILGQTEGFDTDLATGGTLATGKFGLYDVNSGATAINRYYEDVLIFTPELEPIVVHPDQSLEIRHDGAIRANADGTVYGTPSMYRGSRFLLPPAGDEDRTSRIAVKAHRNDIEEAPDSTLGDSLTVQVAYTPRYLTPH